MKKSLLFTLILSLIISCSTSKQIEKAVSSGNYDQAIHDALGKLRTNKDKKGKSDIIVMLQDAFNKASERDLKTIEYLAKDNNPENYLKNYDLYVDLDNRQERIKPILPLHVNNKEVRFNMKDYSNQIITNKNNASQHLYNNASALLKSSNKMDFRYAYNDFLEIENINPNFKDVRQLINLAHEKGTDYVMVHMKNDTQKVIPKRLETDLLNFSTYGFFGSIWKQLDFYGRNFCTIQREQLPCKIKI